jgi:hypothetical protein
MEFESFQTLATVKGVARYTWDPLGEVLFVELIVGPPDTDRILPVSLTPAGAELLMHVLQESLEEKLSADSEEHH